MKHTLACGSPSFTPLLREMSVSGDCKVTFRKEAYSWLSINQDKTEKITCAALLLSTCLYALGIKRISPTQPKIHSDVFCLAITNSLPSSTAVNSLDYLKQWLPYLIINSSVGPSCFPPIPFHLSSLQPACLSLVAVFAYKISQMTLYAVIFSPTLRVWHIDFKPVDSPPLGTDPNVTILVTYTSPSSFRVSFIHHFIAFYFFHTRLPLTYSNFTTFIFHKLHQYSAKSSPEVS